MAARRGRNRKPFTGKDLGRLQFILPEPGLYLETGFLTCQLALGLESNPDTLRIQEPQVIIIARINGTTPKSSRNIIKHDSNATSSVKDFIAFIII
tara:strand:+ start:26 stop:313 length:288 start_codon:yes stop_codon:yes gene_type:complete